MLRIREAYRHRESLWEQQDPDARNSYEWSYHRCAVERCCSKLGPKNKSITFNAKVFASCLDTRRRGLRPAARRSLLICVSAKLRAEFKSIDTEVPSARAIEVERSGDGLESINMSSNRSKLFYYSLTGGREVLPALPPRERRRLRRRLLRLRLRRFFLSTPISKDVSAPVEIVWSAGEWFSKPEMISN